MVHRFGQFSRDYSAPPSNWKDDLSWQSGWVSHGKCISVCDAHWIKLIVNHDMRLLIVMIHQVTILHGLSTLREYLICVKINMRLWPMGETLKWSYPYRLSYYWWRLVATCILNKDIMICHGIEIVSHWVIQKTCDYEICGYSNSFSEIWHMLLGVRVCHLIT